MQTSSSPTTDTYYKCNKCKDTGSIHTFRWVEDESYMYNGVPMRREVGTLRNCDCHYEQQFERYNAAAEFSEKEKGHTFRNAIVDAENEEIFKNAADFIRNIEKHMEWGTWLYIFGDEFRAKNLSEKNGKELSAFGTGKTYLMQCIANALSNRKIPSIYVNEEKLFGDIKATYERGSDENEQDVLRRYYSIPVLMIDDLFSAPYKDWAEGKLFSILDTRVNERKVTIITSNYATGRISSRLPVNGGKIASRITGQAQMIEMIGMDRRRMAAKKRKGESA